MKTGNESAWKVGAIISIAISVVLVFVIGLQTAYLQKIDVHETRITNSERMLVVVKENIAEMGGNVKIIARALEIDIGAK